VKRLRSTPLCQTLIPLARAPFATIVLAAISVVGLSGCGSSMQCSVLRLRISEHYVIQSSHRPSFLGESTTCRDATAKELLVSGDGYVLYVVLTTSQTNPAIFVGVEPHGSGSFEIVARGFLKNIPGSAIRRASHFIQLNGLPDRIVTFDVLNRSTGTTTKYSWTVVGEASCSCRTFDGP